MSDRLKDLQRQRALVQEHLAWLDREIAQESGKAPLAAPSPAAPVAAVVTTPVSKPSRSRIPFADDIIAQYKGRGPSMQAEAKRGCLIAFFVAFALLGAILLAWWFFKYREVGHSNEPKSSHVKSAPACGLAAVADQGVVFKNSIPRLLECGRGFTPRRDALVAGKIGA